MGPASSRKAHILRFAAEITDAPPERPDYFHPVLCQVGLPRRQTKSTSFERSNGNASLLVEAGTLWNGKTFVPLSLP